MKIFISCILLISLLTTTDRTLQAASYDLHSETKNFPDADRGNAKWATFINRDVENLQGDDLGTVTDLAIDMNNGRIAAVLVTTKNFLSLGAIRTVGVPPGAFTNFKEGGEHGTLRLDISEVRFKAAPELKPAQWNHYFQANSLGTTFLYFGVAPYFETGRKGGVATNISLGPVKTTRQILQLPVVDGTSKLGHLDAIRVDAKTERVMYVLVSESKVQSSISEIMASEVQLNKAQDALVFDAAKQRGSAFNRPVGGTDSPRVRKTPSEQVNYPATVP